MSIMSLLSKPHGTGQGITGTKPEVPAVNALPADLLLDSFGVRTSFADKANSAYGGWANSTTVGNGSITPVITAMTDLGIRHAREGIKAASTAVVGGTQSANQATAWAACAAAGIKFISSLGNIGGGAATATPPVKDHLDWILATFPDPTAIFEMFEGPNEPNGTGAFADWPQQVAARVKELYVRTRTLLSTTNAAYAPLSTIPLVNSSIQGGNTQHQKFRDAAAAIGGGVAAENFVDYSCYHVYPGQASGTATSVPSWNVSARNALAKADAPGKGVVCTESGMYDVLDPAVANFAYHPPDVVNVYGPRMLLEHIYRGEKRHYWFELLDDHGGGSTDHEDHIGLVGFGNLYPRKPVYNSLKYMFDLTADPGHLSFVPNALNLTRTGTLTTDYRQVLFKKFGSGGKYYLCMWRDVSIWNKYTNTAVTVSPITMSINLGTANPLPVVLHNPSRQISMSMGTVSSFPVNTDTGLAGLRGEVVIAEIG